MGAPAELYDLPRTAFVANFLGQSNLARGTVVEVRRRPDRRRRSGRRPHRRRARPVVGDRTRGRGRRRRPAREGQPGRAGQRAGRRATNLLGPGTVIDVVVHRASARSTWSTCPGVGVLAVFSQNLGVGTLARTATRSRWRGRRAHLRCSTATRTSAPVSTTTSRRSPSEPGDGGRGHQHPATGRDHRAAARATTRAQVDAVPAVAARAWSGCWSSSSSRWPSSAR